MLRLPWTPKPRTASLEELREQLANAKASHADAQKATASAQAVFDDSGDASAEKALLAARAAEQSAGEHLARAERLADAAETQRKAEQRADLEREAAKLTAELAAPDPEEARLVAEEAAAYEKAVNVRLARRANNESRVERMWRLQHISRELGGESRSLYHHEANPEPSHVPVGERLVALSAGASSHETRSSYLHALSRIQF